MDDPNDPGTQIKRWVLNDYSPYSEYMRQDMGLSYEIKHCGHKVSIMYWAMYKGQEACTEVAKGHMKATGSASLSMSDVAREHVQSVVYYQHSGAYRAYPNKNPIR